MIRGLFLRVGTMSLVGIALALVPGAAEAKSAAVSTLPEGALPKWTVTKPSRIEAKEKLGTLAPRREQLAGVPSHVVLEADADHRACFQTITNGVVSAGAQDRIFAYPKGEVIGARMEQIVVDPQTEKARLETTEIFLDPRTLGVRAGAKVQLELATVARGPGPARVYAFREPDGAIHVLVPTGARGTFRDTKGELGASTCGHVRLTFTPETPNAALVVASLEVTNAQPPADPFARVKLPVPTANPAAMGGANEPKPPKTARVFQIAVSVTRTSRDPEPLLAVSVGLTPGESSPMQMQGGSDFGMGLSE